MQAAGMAAALLGAVALAVAYYHGAAARSPFEDGLVGAIHAYERVLALLGMGLALSRQTVLARWSGVAALTVGIAAGIAGEGNLANSDFVTDHLFVLALPGPVACAIAGLALALSPILQKWLLPGFAVLLGFLVGIAIGLAAPAGSELGFSAGGTLSELWIAITSALFFQSLQRPWVRIFTRILGSWLIAVGILLGGVRLIAVKPAAEALPPPPTLQRFPPSTIPEAVPPPAAPGGFPHGGENEFRQQP
jgi:hypothetical protein